MAHLWFYLNKYVCLHYHSLFVIRGKLPKTCVDMPEYISLRQLKKSVFDPVRALKKATSTVSWGFCSFSSSDRYVCEVSHIFSSLYHWLKKGCLEYIQNSTNKAIQNLAALSTIILESSISELYQYTILSKNLSSISNNIMHSLNRKAFLFRFSRLKSFEFYLFTKTEALCLIIHLSMHVWVCMGVRDTYNNAVVCNIVCMHKLLTDSYSI